MKKVICKKEYDTETAEIIKKVTFGYYGCADGWEETLYKTPTGFYFLYTNGGAESKYTKEKITRMSKVRAAAWVENN